MGPHSLVLTNNQICHSPLLNAPITNTRTIVTRQRPSTNQPTVTLPRKPATLPLIDHVPSTIFPLLHRGNPYGLPKDKVIFVVGATGTGKSRLAIDLATSVGGEVINSDKIQAYQGLDVVTNKVTEEECAGIPHHLLGFLRPQADFTVANFCSRATDAIEGILSRGKVPVIAGGSNRYIEALVDRHFRSRFDCCFLWVDMGLGTLDRFVSERVDRMMRAGMLDEVRQVFDPLDRDYSRGLRRAIGVPEMDAYMRVEAEQGPESPMAKRVLGAAIDEVKANTCKLVRRQLEKIHRLGGLPGWHLHRLDATKVMSRRERTQDDAWVRHVAAPASGIVMRFLDHNKRVTVAPVAVAVR